jgi:AcrR family transcriptional regulator
MITSLAPVELSRAELFARVWAEPMTKVAVDLGLSPNGLAKICERLAVPYPSRGHWARARAGRPPAPPALPEAPEGAGEQVTISPGRSIHRRARQRMSVEDRRAQLLGLAAEVVSKDGLSALTIKRLAREAGVTAPQAYHYFSDADQVLIELGRRELSAVRAAQVDRIETSQRPAERLALSTTTYLREVEARGVLLQVLLNAPVVRSALRREQRQIRARNTQMLGARFSQSRNVPEDFALAATSILTSVVLRTGRILARGRISLAAAEILANDMVESCNRRLAREAEDRSTG